MMNKIEYLKNFWGHGSFREGQEELIDATISGRDVLGVMPTGGGKSVCYQLPALMMPGVTLVVSPLISLMKDQVTALREMGISAAYINSSMDMYDLREILSAVRQGRYKLVYVAPERLAMPDFIESIGHIDVSSIAVDEAHCISHWGQDFRPNYLKIAEFIDRLDKRPIVSAYTATATPRVQEDIVKTLKLKTPLCVVTGFDRPNLFFDVLRPKDKLGTLQKLLNERAGKSGIIYCSTRREVDELCEKLSENGFSVSKYHAGLAAEERKNNQSEFVYDRKEIMIATNAFGMGIDKSNVSFVIHYNMPKSIEAYYQEAGRAGRDGENADCILLYAPKDVAIANLLASRPDDNDELSEEEKDFVAKQNQIRLNAMVSYCRTTYCLRGVLMDYFGQKHEEECGNCGNCKRTYVETDITIPAQKILSCVQRAYKKLGYSLGATMIADILHGSKSQRIMDLGLNELSTYAIMQDEPIELIREYIEALEAHGHVIKDARHGGLMLTPAAVSVLKGEETVSARLRERSSEERARKNKGKIELARPQDDTLFEHLRRLRYKIAQEVNLPAYMVFHDSALSGMASMQPTTREELLRISGVGKRKAEEYGERFLEEIRAYLAEKNRGEEVSHNTERTDDDIEDGLSVGGDKGTDEAGDMVVTSTGRQRIRDMVSGSRESSYEPWTEEEDEGLKELFRQGKSIREIAELHKRSNGAIRARLKKLGLIKWS